nr:hypothetical protein [uncultured Allomuricauda sp.]
MGNLRLKTILRTLLELINDTDKVNTISSKTEKFINENGYSKLVDLIEAERATKVIDGQKVLNEEDGSGITLDKNGVVVWNKNGKKYKLKRVGSKEVPNLQMTP